MRRTILLAAAAATLATGACFSERGDGIAAPEGSCRVPAGAFGRDRAVVIIRGFAFHPDTLSVEPGTTVTWVNCEEPGTDAHTSTSDTDVWNSGALVPGDTYERRFDAAGEFGYFCIPHPFMRGAIHVE